MKFKYLENTQAFNNKKDISVITQGGHIIKVIISITEGVLV